MQFAKRPEQENFQNFCAKIIWSTLSEMINEERRGMVNDTFHTEVFNSKIKTNIIWTNMGWGYTLFVITIVGDLVYFTVSTNDDNSVCYNE